MNWIMIVVIFGISGVAMIKIDMPTKEKCEEQAGVLLRKGFDKAVCVPQNIMSWDK